MTRLLVLGAAVAGLAATSLLTLPAAASTTAPTPSTSTPARVGLGQGTSDIGGPLLRGTGTIVRPLAGADPLPDLDAEGFLIADLTAGTVLAARNAHTLFRPASTIKTLTATVTLNKLALTKVYRAVREDAQADGGKVGMVPGLTYTVKDMLYGLLLPSGNDAASGLANAYGGEAQIVSAMQAEVVRAQANDTRIVNPSGLDADGQVTTPYDLALIAADALENEGFRKITKAVNYSFPGLAAQAGEKRPTFQIYTQNRLLLRGFDGAIGGKTGFTTQARRTFWGAATRDGRTILITTFRNKTDTYSEAKAMLEWGFANATAVEPVGTLVKPIPEGGLTPSATAESSAKPVSASPSATPTAPALDNAAGGGSSNTTTLLVLLLALAAGGAAFWFSQRGGRGDEASPVTVDSTPPRGDAAGAAAFVATQSNVTQYRPNAVTPPSVQADVPAPPTGGVPVESVEGEVQEVVREPLGNGHVRVIRVPPTSKQRP